MDKTALVTLDDRDAGLVRQAISNGDYASPEEVVSAGLKLLGAKRAQLEEIRAALVHGERSGVSRRNVAEIWSAVKGALPRPRG